MTAAVDTTSGSDEIKKFTFSGDTKATFIVNDDQGTNYIQYYFHGTIISDQWNSIGFVPPFADFGSRSRGGTKPMVLHDILRI